MGRPSDYDPAYCDKVVELGNEGASVVEMAHEIGVVKQTLYDWEKVHPEFLDAFTRARQASQVWWEKAGRTNMMTAGFNGSVWSRSMAARFPNDWREVKGTELTGRDGGPLEVKAEKAEWVILDAPVSDGA